MFNLRRVFTIIIIIFASFLISAYIPIRYIGQRDYLIVGQNSVQKIYYQASSNYSKIHRGNMAMDSDRNTAWISAQSSGPHWLEIDFQVKRIMSKIIIYPGKKDNYVTMRYFKLQFMYKDRWFDFATCPVAKRKSPRRIGQRKKIVIDLGGLDASTFRIYIPADASINGYAAIAEIETYIGGSRIKYFDERLKGLYFPIKNGFLPSSNRSYPNSPRSYRGGRHVGLDIYTYHEKKSYDPKPVTSKTPVYAAESGVVMRADWNYKPMTLREWRLQSQYFRSHPRTFVKRSFGGRQVWIDHENGIVTTYNHLSRIARTVRVGRHVRKGQRIGWVGNSGMSGEAEGKQYGMHLHFEIWIDGYYLGYGMAMNDVKKYITWIFFPLQ